MHLADAAGNYPLHKLNVGHYSGRKKLCIYGGGPFREFAPLEEPDWDVWTCNLIAPLTRHQHLRADLWFDLHQRCAQSADDMRWIARCPVPIYVPDDLLDAGPNCTRFPLDEIVQAFRTRYFAVTFAYQMALAMHRGHYTHIGLYGVDLAFGTPRERTVEWACMSYWLGRAQHAGLRIQVPKRSMLGQHAHLYGFEYIAERNYVDGYIDAVVTGDAARGYAKLARMTGIQEG